MRNPLAALRTYAQLLMRRLEPESTHQSLVRNMLEEQNQLGRYVNAIDNLGRESLPGSSLDSTGPMLLPPAGDQLGHPGNLDPASDRTGQSHGHPAGSPMAWARRLALLGQGLIRGWECG